MPTKEFGGVVGSAWSRGSPAPMGGGCTCNMIRHICYHLRPVLGPSVVVAMMIECEPLCLASGIFDLSSRPFLVCTHAA